MTLTYEQPDFLCVGCFGWSRAKNAREAYRICRANASPHMLKPEQRRFRIWRLPDQADQVTVNEMGGWSVRPGEGQTLGDNFKALLVWVGDERAALKRVPEFPIDPVE